MPITPTSAKGTVGIMIEGTSGEQVLLPATIALATITGIATPSGSTGMRLHIIISAWATSGTFVITGVGSPGNTETVTVAAPTTQQTQSQAGYTFEYVSVNAYTAITNITTTGGVTGSLLTVKGVQAAKFNIPVTSFKSNRKMPPYSPNEFSGLMARDKRMIVQTVDTSIDNLDSVFYGDLSLYWVYLMMGIPNWVSLPASPTSLLATTALTSSPIVLTTPPTAPGMKFIITATGYVATPVTLTLNGSVYGVTTTETILINANGTYYSANAYNPFTNITTSSNSSGVSIAVTGVFGWKGTITSEGTKQTAALEHWDGSASWTHPYSFMSDGDMTIKAKGESMLTLKGFSQDKLAIGDRTTNPLQVSRVTSLGIPLGDLPIAGWQTAVTIDSITGTPGTTGTLDFDEEIKIVLKTPDDRHWTFNNTQAFTRAYALKYECTVDVTYDIVNLLQNEQFRQNLKQYLVVNTSNGEWIGTTGGTAYYKGWTWTLPVRYDGEYGQEAQVGKGNVMAKPKLRTEYDAQIAGAYQLVIVTRNPPTYNA